MYLLLKRYRLGTVAFCNNIKLSVETLKLLQVFCLEYTQEFILDLGNLPLIGNLIKILNA